ncbi:MAG: hypothetical protein HDQ87_08610 [Clostridia bacterium]|nr:hypothetical protein [Clostridia bacterium]
MPGRDHKLERRENTARHELTVVMEETTYCREHHEVTLGHLRRWLHHLNRAGHLLLSDLELEIDNSLPESAWLWTAIDGTLSASRQVVEIRHRIIARSDSDALSGGLYEELGIDVQLKGIQECVSQIMTLIPRNTDLMPEAYGEG